MRAITYSAYGDEHVLQYRTDFPDPVPGEGELLVRVKAAGVNPVDWKVTAGYAKDHLDIRMPVIPGWDVAGVVEALGPGAEGFAVGDGIFAYDRTPVVQQGTYAELTVVPASYAAPRPENGTWAQAGGLPLVGLTALKSLEAIGGVGPEDTVLIHAAAGGVGSTAVQIAKARGAYVIGTASAAKHDFLRSIGADEAIDYHTVDVAEVLTDIDVVLDPISTDTEARARSFAVLRPGGTFITILPMPIGAEELAKIAELGIRYEALLVEADHAGMQAIAALAQTGALRAHVEAVFPLAEAAKAHALGETNRVTGKIVLTVE